MNFQEQPQEGARNIKNTEGATQQEQGEKVVAAALSSGGVIFIGRNHGEAMERLIEERPDLASGLEIEEGFVTTEGRFVTREEAHAIAEKEGQLKGLTDGARLQSYQVDFVNPNETTE